MLVILLLFCSLCYSAYGMLNIGQTRRSENYAPCDEGWYYFGEKCYRVGRSGRDEVGYETAIRRCNEMGGEVASIHSKEQSEFFSTFLTRNLREKVWIGLTDRKVESKFVWEDGSPVNYVNWREGEPNNEYEEDCVQLIFKPVKGRIGWNDVPCELNFPYICQKNMNYPGHKTTAQSAKCPGLPWRDFGGQFCYFIETKHKLTWYKAQEECIQKGGILASISSEEEEKILEPFVKPLGSLFIGLSNIITDGGKYVWSDGSQLKYSNWAPGEPNDSYERCVQISKRSMSWKDISCSSKSAYICQVKKVPEEIKEEILNFELIDYWEEEDDSNYISIPGRLFSIENLADKDLK